MKLAKHVTSESTQLQQSNCVRQVETGVFDPFSSLQTGLRFKTPDCGGHRLCLFTLELGHCSLFLYLLFLILPVLRLLIEQRLPELLVQLEPSLCIGLI